MSAPASGAARSEQRETYEGEMRRAFPGSTDSILKDFGVREMHHALCALGPGGAGYWARVAYRARYNRRTDCITFHGRDGEYLGRTIVRDSIPFYTEGEGGR